MAAMRPSAGAMISPSRKRRDAVGIAEEVGDVERGDDEHPRQRRPNEEEDQRQAGGNGDELVTVAVHRREAVDDRIDDAVAVRH